MENKSIEITELLIRINKESLGDYKIVDFWEADTTAICIIKGNILIYISSFNYDRTHKYNVITEKYDTGEIIDKEKEYVYDELVEIIKRLDE